ncbi:MAG: beta-lactamase class [Patescibacteria group bacterium]|nr:beta-lactamase class [Patescibacteria group bacterium]
MTIGIYVRNLNNGPWFGINENEKYSPASMMKVPILITFLKWIEQDSLVLDKKIFISKDSTSLNQYFKPLTDIIV